MQGSTEVFFRKARFWDGGGQDAPPVFLVDGINYLHVKVTNGELLADAALKFCPGDASHSACSLRPCSDG